ncbi:sporulation integral membrane protein YlbJ [Desulfovirgula thermocuniculi]|uniref:sporulation integral membrane protein YlbJ n=1 Tax=Desulfovirgula thermocuniculi TaxID=348842 RepID=UPI000412D8EA|nr:sporulation integral membrane protein YlbJ [Desulfovirgula thermocuniculi]
MRLFWTAGILFFVLGMILQPRLAYEGAVFGLQIWWNIVFPSLLPFFIASELLMNFGFVHFLGVLLEPVMRPLFNVPGAGSLVMAIGYTSGYPTGALATARLRTLRLCTRVEAERLMAFTSNSSPLFMLVAVAVGMFHNPSLGPIIAGGHYLASLTLGLAMRFYGRGDREAAASPPDPAREGTFILKRAWQEMVRRQEQIKGSAGQIMGEAVKNSLQNLFNIGGFIILFAVLIRLLTRAGFIDLLAALLGKVLVPAGLNPAVLPALASGIFEMTTGTKLASEAPAPLAHRLAAAAAILAWSGLSVQAQAASVIASTDIRMAPFLLARAAHAVLATLYTLAFLRLAAPVLFQAAQAPIPSPALPAVAWPTCLASLLALATVLLAMIALGLVREIICLLTRAIRLIRI